MDYRVNVSIYSYFTVRVLYSVQYFYCNLHSARTYCIVMYTCTVCICTRKVYYTKVEKLMCISKCSYTYLVSVFIAVMWLNKYTSLFAINVRVHWKRRQINKWNANLLRRLLPDSLEYWSYMMGKRLRNSCRRTGCYLVVSTRGSMQYCLTIEATSKTLSTALKWKLCKFILTRY